MGVATNSTRVPHEVLAEAVSEGYQVIIYTRKEETEKTKKRSRHRSVSYTLLQKYYIGSNNNNKESPHNNKRPTTTTSFRPYKKSSTQYCIRYSAKPCAGDKKIGVYRFSFFFVFWPLSSCGMYTLHHIYTYNIILPYLSIYICCRSILIIYIV